MILPKKTQVLLQELVRNNLPTHALLIHCEYPSPLENIAKGLVQLWCDEKETMQTGLTYESHPDIISLIPEPTHKIESIRKIQDITKYGPQTLKRQFIIIHHADTLTVQAANALLKTLESPPKGVCFILLTHNANKILPTIASRCQLLFCPKFIEQNEETYPVSLNDIRQMSLSNRFELAEKLIQQKEILVPTLNQWLQESLSNVQTDTTLPHSLFETLKRLTYNVNARLQIEDLMIKIGGSPT